MKYNWTYIPLEIKWVSSDSDGWKFYHIEKPTIDIDQGGWFAEEANCYEGYVECLEPRHNEYQGDWKDSLEERPSC